jgi:hypothetical protein
MSGSLLAHNVFFTLKDGSAENRRTLLRSIAKHLTGHPGTVFFASGVLEDTLQRPVNDRNFDVALHIIFASKADHDAYQVHPRHLQFIEENKADWKQVRVFDSTVEQA